MKQKKNIRWNTMKILAFGFLGIILLGGILLSLPVCNTKPIAFQDALFTSTTAVCVTGLVTITPATQFTLIGQVILLILTQIGGLGVVACAAAFFLIMKKRITVKQRIVIQETYNMDAPGGMVRLIRQVIVGTFFVEGCGAVLYAFQFVPEYGWIRGIWYSVFHAISAFCNAGIDILGTTSFIRYVGNPIMNITTMLLIVVGGLGFTVWQDIISTVKAIRKQRIPRRRWFATLRLHSKIVLVMTVGLILVGALNFFLMEYDNPATMGTLNTGEKIFASFFHSVSTRTAGFATVPQAGLHSESKFVSCLLMFIGGSPAGTAGGVKTTTIAMLILTCFTVVKGGRDTECFGRKISTQNIRTGFTVVMVSFSTLMIGTTIVTMLEPSVDFIRVLYETTSAVATVGLSADLTPNLGRASQVVIMIMMYVGRIGPITLALLFGSKSRPQDKIRELPEQRIMVG